MVSTAGGALSSSWSELRNEADEAADSGLSLEQEHLPLVER